MELEIVPEPTDEERAAIAAAVAEEPSEAPATWLDGDEEPLP